MVNRFKARADGRDVLDVAVELVDARDTFGEVLLGRVVRLQVLRDATGRACLCNLADEPVPFAFKVGHCGRARDGDQVAMAVSRGRVGLEVGEVGEGARR